MPIIVTIVSILVEANFEVVFVFGVFSAFAIICLIGTVKSLYESLRVILNENSTIVSFKLYSWFKYKIYF